MIDDLIPESVWITSDPQLLRFRKEYVAVLGEVSFYRDMGLFTYSEMKNSLLHEKERIAIRDNKDRTNRIYQEAEEERVKQYLNEHGKSPNIPIKKKDDNPENLNKPSLLRCLKLVERQIMQILNYMFL